MLKKLSKILLFTFALLLVGCVNIGVNSSNDSISSSIEINLEDVKTTLISKLPTSIDSNFVVPNLDSYKEVQITYVSNNQEVLSNDGVFTKPIEDGTLSIEITLGLKDDTLVFNHNLTVKGYTVVERLNAAKSEIVIPSTTNSNLELKTIIEKYGVSVAWLSSNSSVISNSGIYTKPENDTLVTLKATLSYETEELIQEFSVNAIGLSDSEKLEIAKTNLNLSINSTKTDFDLPAVGLYGSVVSWKSQNKTFLNVIDAKAIVTRPHETFSDEVVKLIATISVNGLSIDKEFEVTIESYKVIAAVFTAPDKTTYYVGEQQVSLVGGSVEITLDDQTKKVIELTNDMVESFNLSQSGNYDIALSYFGYTYSYEVKVINPVSNLLLDVNESVNENFDDFYNPKLNFDYAQVPNCYIINSDLSIDGASLYFESSGAFKTLFINGGVEYVPNATYRVTFDYKLLTIVDTIYFQLNSPLGAKYTQFGGQPANDIIKHFEYLVTLDNTSEYLIQIFPGSGVGLTSLIIDDIKIERIIPENNVNANGNILVGQYVLETFGDSANKVFDLDLAPTPNSILVHDSRALEGTSLYFSSNGNYSGIYIKNSVLFTQNGKYRVTFDYKLITLNNTIYIQFTSSAGNLFTEINGITPSEDIKQFEYIFNLGSGTDYMIQIFTGSGNGLTEMVIDNLKIERMEIENTQTETNHYVSGELNEGNYVLETFDDLNNAIFGLDRADATNFEIIDNGIEGKSLYFVSNGTYFGAYFNNPSIIYTPNAKYLVEFDYKVLSIADTIYFQFTSSDSSKNVFVQFGGSSSIDTVQKFSSYVTLQDATDYVIKMFPGGTLGESKLIIDNLRITRMSTNIYSATILNVGEKVKETFDDQTLVYGIDTSPTPDSQIVNDGNAIAGTSLLLKSLGNYNGFYLTNSTIYSANSTYKISFDYKVVTINGALYIKVYSDTIADSQINVINDGLINNYSFDFSIGDSGAAVIQLFPNSPCEIYFDNIIIERIG